MLDTNKQSIFSEVNSNGNRLTRYEVRDEHHGYYCQGNKIHEHLFCFTCNSKECNDKSHDHRELHPVLRIPKKNANKLKWKRFYSEYNKFGKYNLRRNRH